MLVLLGVQTLLLFEHNKGDSRADDNGQRNQPCHKSPEAVGDDESCDGATGYTGRPVDVPPLNPHKFKRPLQPLEQWVIGILLVLAFHRATGLVSQTEEQRQSLGGCNQEDTGADDHHDLLLENLLPNCKVLNINTPKKQKVPKETNWKQKFQKPQNENICLTYLNTEMNGNFHFLSFCAAFLKVQNQVL